uniref:Uncharacterized protein n=1 Tax=Brassica oleracea var. oleracea TaxID=109376 RepID=A0A0D3B9J0_BRAOL
MRRRGGGDQESNMEDGSDEKVRRDGDGGDDESTDTRTEDNDCLTYHVNSASPLEHTETPAQESCFSSCAQPPAPKKVYCRRSSSPPPPAKYMYITGVPGELYRTGPGDQWGYYSSANNNINTIKSLLVIVIVGWFGAIINV